MVDGRQPVCEGVTLCGIFQIWQVEAEEAVATSQTVYTQTLPMFTGYFPVNCGGLFSVLARLASLASSVIEVKV